jgi:hypothetical protein
MGVKRRWLHQKLVSLAMGAVSSARCCRQRLEGRRGGGLKAWRGDARQPNSFAASWQPPARPPARLLDCSLSCVFPPAAPAACRARTRSCSSWQKWGWAAWGWWQKSRCRSVAGPGALPATCNPAASFRLRLLVFAPFGTSWTHPNPLPALRLPASLACLPPRPPACSACQLTAWWSTRGC